MTAPSERPRIALTMGDPAGVGPEIIAAVWADPRVHEACRPVVFGDAATMQRAAKLRGLAADVAGATLDDAFERSSPEWVPCLKDLAGDGLEVRPGKVTAATGQAAYDAVVRAAQATLAGDCDAIVTGPLSKAALHAAGRLYPGHTELLAELCGVREFAMMLYLPKPLAPRTRAGLGVVHTTLHISLRNAIDALNTESILEKCRLAHDAARAYGATPPRIGVAALNPHGGEEGLFGDEESRLIRPAVEQAREAGIDATGPWPVDTLMVRAIQGEFDAVVAMYHDQGHIALKLLGMHGAVNITLGLPIVRTSVAHGTAADLAWQGVAETSGMIAAIGAAASLARQKLPTN